MCGCVKLVFFIFGLLSGFSVQSAPSFQTIQEINNLLSCDFENGSAEFCNWGHHDLSDEFDWTRLNSATPTADTGPIFDHTIGDSTGHYVYTESSAPRKVGERAALISQQINTWNSNYMCFTMWYHAYGVDLGNISIFLQQTEFINKTTTLWTFDKTSDDTWKEAKTSIIPTGPFKLIIEVTLGEGFKNDFAIDDLSISSGECTSSSSLPGPSLVG